MIIDVTARVYKADPIHFQVQVIVEDDFDPRCNICQYSKAFVERAFMQLDTLCVFAPVGLPLTEAEQRAEGLVVFVPELTPESILEQLITQFEESIKDGHVRVSLIHA